MSTRQVDMEQMRPIGHADVRASVGAFATQWGRGTVRMVGGVLTLVELPSLDELVAAAAGPATAPKEGVADAGGSVGVTHGWTAQLEGYFRGERLSWRADEIPWEGLSLGVFERAVYEALLTVPPGETVSYGELAEMAGYPRAARAVGTAMAQNPLPIVIPCHRVIKADGKLGNYGKDPRWKKILLDHERGALQRGSPL